MKCERCGGKGEIKLEYTEGFMIGVYHEKCPDCNGTGEKPESQDEKIRENNVLRKANASDYADSYQYYVRIDKDRIANTLWQCSYDGYIQGQKSRDEEVSYYKKIEILQKTEITALRAQIEEMKCLYAENYRQLLAEAKSLYQHYPNNFRKTEDEYFLEENEFLTELEKEK